MTKKKGNSPALHANSSATPQHPGITLEHYATHKGVPVDFLKSLGLRDANYKGIAAIRMDYYDKDGRLYAVRYRTALDGNDKFRWRKGDKPILYGLNQLERALGEDSKDITIVEGESDAHTLWFNDISAIGLPSASTWNEDRDAPLFDSFQAIYVVIEPDAGGNAILAWLEKSTIRDRAKLIRLGRFKDPSDMFRDDPGKFKRRWEETINSAAALVDVDAEKLKQTRKEAWKQCKAIASSENILVEFANELERSGLVGERRNAKLIYLAMVSRFFKRPVSIAVKGTSSGGKSFLVETVLKFFPAKTWFAITSMSNKALIYLNEDMRHRFLVIYEAEGMKGEEQSYLLRTLLSEGRIRYSTVFVDSNGPVGKQITLEGPTGLCVTTTKVSLHPENETRLLSLTVLESEAQTQAVLSALAAESESDLPDFERWHALQVWLSLKPHRTVIPYAKVLAELIPPVAIRLRRDFKAILSLIRAHALLHRRSREINENGEVVAEIADYDAIRHLVAHIVAQGVEAAVSLTVRATVNAIGELQNGDPERGISNAALAKHLKLHKSTMSRRVQGAIERGYLQNLQTRKGVPGQYVIGDPMPEEQEILPTPGAIEAAVAALQAKGRG